jgi:hypothetical protein
MRKLQARSSRNGNVKVSLKVSGEFADLVVCSCEPSPKSGREIYWGRFNGGNDDCDGEAAALSCD